MKATDPGSHIFGSDDRAVFRIIVYCLSLAFSVMVASLETLRLTSSGFAFHVSWRTLLTFIFSGVFFVACFKVIFLSPSRKRRAAAWVPVVMIGLASFLYPLRFVPIERFGQIFTGLGIAFCSLLTIGGILFGISRFLNADQRRAEFDAQSGAAHRPQS